MQKHLIAVAVLIAYSALASSVRSQNPSAQQPGAPARPPGAAPAPDGLPEPPAAGANVPVDMKQVSYAIGLQFGTFLKANGISPDMESVAAGINDILTGAKRKYTDDQLRQTMVRFDQQIKQQAAVKHAKNKKAEVDFLARNKTQPGVQTTTSGLQFKVLQAGKGASPTIDDVVRCNYRGTLINGTEFDSSKLHGDKPAEFRVGEVIPGWTEALQKMKVGDKWQLFIPSELAYNLDPPPDSPIEPGSMLIFEIELVNIAGQ